MKGSIEVICGPMFSGKTSELLRRLERLSYASKKYLVFKPALDSRFSEDDVVSHNQDKIQAISVDAASEILSHVSVVDDLSVIAIDEAQFFSIDENNNLIEVVLTLKARGYRVILNGLDMDYKGKPFGLMPELLAVANKILKLTAVCRFPNCGCDAEMTYKYTQSKEEYINGELIELGEEDKYEARCFSHWSPSDLFKK